MITFPPSLQSSQQESILLHRIVHIAQHLAHCHIQIHFFCFHFITEVKYFQPRSHMSCEYFARESNLFAST